MVAFERPHHGAIPREAMGRVRHLHFVGIGGSGMSGIAEVLLNLGYRITGSDRAANTATDRLAKLGAEIVFEHSAANIAGADAVVVSTAIAADNPELRAARETRVPVVRRAEMLAELMRFRYGIAIAGTHGKTTTTSLVASILAEAGLDPTFVIGGVLTSAGASARLGAGRYLVAEADESDASFLHLQPMIAVVTNIDADHMQTYGGDFARLRQTFLEFLYHLPFYGLAVLCIDDRETAALLPKVARPVRTYGIERDDADLAARNLRPDGGAMQFDLVVRGEPPVPVRLNLPGRHNVRNSLAAAAVALEIGVGIEHVQAALAGFAGIGRRFQIHDDVRLGDARVTTVDDYGHHPAEIAATLDAARAVWPQRRLVLAFQPHRYSRTRDLFDDFCRELSRADALLIVEVYPAGEAPIANADGRALARGVRARGVVEPVFVERVEALPAAIETAARDGDVVLLMGAGSIGRIAAQIAAGGGA